MALVLNEEQQFLKDAASKFFQDDAPISHFREMRDSNNELGYSKELWTKMANLGWAGILVSEEYGGSDFGMMGMGTILEEAGKTLNSLHLYLQLHFWEQLSWNLEEMKNKNLNTYLN